MRGGWVFGQYHETGEGGIPLTRPGELLCLVVAGVKLNEQYLLRDPGPYIDYGPPSWTVYRCRYCKREFVGHPAPNAVREHIDARCLPETGMMRP